MTTDFIHDGHPRQMDRLGRRKEGSRKDETMALDSSREYFLLC